MKSSSAHERCGCENYLLYTVYIHIYIYIINQVKGNRRPIINKGEGKETSNKKIENPADWNTFNRFETTSISFAFLSAIGYSVQGSQECLVRYTSSFLSHLRPGAFIPSFGSCTQTRFGGERTTLGPDEHSRLL